MKYLIFTLSILTNIALADTVLEVPKPFIPSIESELESARLSFKVEEVNNSAYLTMIRANIKIKGQQRETAELLYGVVETQAMLPRALIVSSASKICRSLGYKGVINVAGVVTGTDDYETKKKKIVLLRPELKVKHLSLKDVEALYPKEMEVVGAVDIEMITGIECLRRAHAYPSNRN